ncbi:MAG: hypothetical protein K2N64_08140 [Anaeroplasmataceae bacterium]|nr:hypothetical protein [Anaeroplasmataceae bacterium]
MPKVKNHIIREKKDYLYLTIDIVVSICCILLIGRVGLAGKTLALFFSFLVGDFSTIILAFILGYCIIYLFFKKKIDFHHISFIGTIFIFISFLLFAHLGLYDALGMKNTNILSKTLELYKHYLKSYNISYSCGGGILGAIFLQVSCLLVSKIGSILVGIAFLGIGISYFANLKLLKIFKGGRLTKASKQVMDMTKKYFKNIHYPTITKKSTKKMTIQSLEDTDEQVNFTLQNEINKEKFMNLKNFVKEHKIYVMIDEYKTSYSASRMILKFAHRSEEEMKAIQGFFNRQCFFLKKGNEYVLDYPNQFRKLLTLKSMLLEEEGRKRIPLAVDVDGSKIYLDPAEGRLLVLTGDPTSGIKTFIRGMILSILIKNVVYSDIYFYDFDHEFPQMNKEGFLYVNNEKSAGIALDEAFSEYERRSEVLKYFNCDTIAEANLQIKKSNSQMELILPQFHFLCLDLAAISSSLYQKIMYAVRFSTRVGITMIVVARNKNALAKLELNKCDIIAFNMSDVSTSVKLFGTDMACRLQKKGDVLIRKEGTLFHGQTPYVSISDFEKIKG